MNIVCATDDNFVQHCCVMLISILKNNKNVTIYLLSEGLTSYNQKLLKDEIELQGGVYNYIIVDSETIKQLPMPDLAELNHISPATYYRLQIDKLLPDSIDKVIYLDCDIIVRKSLDDLWNTNIDRYAIAAISQFPSEHNCKRLNYDSSFTYFNAGVLLINLNYWRKNSVSERLIRFLTDNYGLVKYHDQDALNFVLHKSRLSLSPKWNMLYPYFIFRKDNIKDLKLDINNVDVNNFFSVIKNEKNDPTLIHYSSKPKPWEENCYHPWRNEYYKYALFSEAFKGIKRPSFFRALYASLKQNIINDLSFIKGKVLKGYKNKKLNV